MYINLILEFTMTLDNEKFYKIFKFVYSKNDYIEKKEGEYVDQSLEEKGVTVIYRDSQYKKKIKLIVNTGYLLGNGEHDPDKIARKLNKRIGEYFGFKYKLNDFILSGMRFVTDIDVGTHDEVATYLKVFRRIGRVKGFSPVSYECFENVDSFCLERNSNGIDFMIYDLEGLYRQLNEDDIRHKKLKSMIRESEGTLRAHGNQFSRMSKIRIEQAVKHNFRHRPF